MVGFMMFATRSFSQSNQANPSTAVNTTSPVQEQASDGLPARVQRLEFDVETLKEKNKGLDDKLTFIVIALAFFLTVFAAVPGVYSFVMERNSEKRAHKAFKLAYIGEKASQDRADQVHQSFLAGSMTTLNLVNSTLELSKEASQRAANLVQDNARASLRSLDNEAKTLLSDAKESRELITNSRKRSKLVGLGAKINGFEISRIMLTSVLPLTPHCEFIRGLDFHLKQQFDDAKESWSNVAVSESAEPSLRGLAYYWIGMERNNLGEFAEAEISFRNSEEFEKGPWVFELQRIRLESHFFDRSHPARASISAFDDLIQRILRFPMAEVQNYYDRASATYGNVLFQSGNEAEDETEAIKFYSDARDVFYKIKDRNSWALFGLGQALQRLKKYDEAKEILSGPARKNAVGQFSNRVEPLTKVSAKTTELICCAYTFAKGSEMATMYDDLMDALGLVDDRLMVYSQFQKRNLTKEDFVRELDSFISEL